MYSVDTEEEAHQLLVAACTKNINGEFVAYELAEEQTLENLYAFGRRLERTHKMIQERRQANEGAS